MKFVNKYGMRLSKIGLGTGRLGTVISKELSFEMLDMFYKHGGNVIDTARNYYEWVENGRGKSEQTIGEWLVNRGIRDRVHISTKGGVHNEGKTFYMDLSKENLLKECQQSMEASAYAMENGLEPISVVQTWWSIAAYTPNMWNDPTSTWMVRCIVI